MSKPLWQRVKLFHESDYKVFFVVTGSSLKFTDCLMASGGASRTVLGVYCPYSEELLKLYVASELGSKFKAVSSEVAKAMCDVALKSNLLPENSIVVASTAALSKRENERKDRLNIAHLCISTGTQTLLVSHDYTFIKNDPDVSIAHRQIQENILANDILEALLDFVGIK